jgi:hypothetical protein
MVGLSLRSSRRVMVPPLSPPPARHSRVVGRDRVGGGHACRSPEDENRPGHGMARRDVRNTPTPDPSPPHAGGGNRRKPRASRFIPTCSTLRHSFRHALPIPRLKGRGLSLSVPAPSLSKARGVKRRQARRRNAASWPRELPRGTGLRIAEARRLASASLRWGSRLYGNLGATDASRRASRRFTAAFVVIRVRASGAEDRRRGGR